MTNDELIPINETLLVNPSQIEGISSDGGLTIIHFIGGDAIVVENPDDNT